MARDQRRPSRTDLLVAAGCGTAAMAGLALLPGLAQVEPEAAGGAPETGSAAWWAVMITLAAQATVLVWRRQHPEAVAGATAAAVLVGAAAGAGAAIGLTSVALVVAVWSLATRRPPARVWPVLAAVGALVAVGHALAGRDAGVTAGEAILTGVVQAAVLVGAPLVLAALVVARRESRTARDDRLLALEREHAALVDAAVARERTAMARELHDIAAHHLTGISVMSAAIGTQIDTDPEGAKLAVGEVRRQSTAVLRDLRSLVGLLRDQDGTTGAGEPVPAVWATRVETLAGVPRLVADVVAAGQDVTLTVLGPPDGRSLGAGVGPLAQLAAYRTVQESLANAGRHAPNARCAVEVDDRDPAALLVTVRNDAARHAPDPGARGGLGLVGMRERAELTASHLDVGPRPDGGWQVRLLTPRADPEDRG